MTNNEIIIDGVNVAECEWMIDGKDVIGCNSYICCCEEINNCYFKQLQRAKAELKQYKKSKQASYETMQKEWNKAVNELRELKAENEELKKEKYQNYKNIMTDSAINLQLSNMQNEINKLYAENDTLHITISKLKEDLSQAETSLYAWKAENEKLKSRNKLYKKIIVENQQKYHNQIMILKACIKGEINIDDFKNYAKFQQENKKLKEEVADLEELAEFKEKYIRELSSNINVKIGQITAMEMFNKQANEYNLKYKQALKKIEEIAYTTDFDIVDIQEVVDEVLKHEKF